MWCPVPHIIQKSFHTRCSRTSFFPDDHTIHASTMFVIVDWLISCQSVCNSTR
uniref:Uncharacterized protein n=1 Tax=Dunaliella salina TaxID=3046 RepID=L7Z9B7_DUNSA|nr:hypothetical protein [Dunaliella salina]AGE10683.1 hypothetical protein [Dunaliella salina]